MYSSASEAVLLAWAQRGDEAALEELLERYKPLVTKKAKQYYLPGAEVADLIQEGMIALFKAVGKCRPCDYQSFPAFASQCVVNRLKDAIRLAAGLKHSALNQSLSLEQLQTTPGARQDWVASVTMEEQADAETEVLSKLCAHELGTYLSAALSTLEYSALLLHSTGFTAKEIALLLHTTAKSVETAVARARRKGRKFVPGEGEDCSDAPK